MGMGMMMMMMGKKGRSLRARRKKEGERGAEDQVVGVFRAPLVLLPE